MRGGLDAAAAAAHARAVPLWTADATTLCRRFAFADFDAAWDLVARVAAVAMTLDHHPDIRFGWGYAEFVLTTHAVRGLTARDFALAGRIDAEAEPAR